jgi:hypothetical protein
MALDGIGQRLQQGGGLADPIGQGRAVEIDTFALEDLRLAIKRKASRAGDFTPTRSQNRT